MEEQGKIRAMDKVISSLTESMPDEWDTKSKQEQRVRQVYEDPRRVKDLVNELRLPSVDSKAPQREIEEMQRAIEERKATRSHDGERARKRKEDQMRYQQMVDSVRRAPVRVRKGTKRYLKVVIRSIMAIFKLLKDSIKSKLARRDAKLRDLDDAMKLYYDVCKGWLLTAIKRPLISIV